MATTTQDAPDYTLLSDVNVVGSVAIDVNVVGSVAIDVYVQNSSLNVYIMNATLDVKAEITNSSIDVYVKNATLDVHALIMNDTINVNATITQCPITLNVNVQNTKLDVNITNATLNVNITNQVVQTANPRPCLAFDGVDDYINCGNPSILNNITELTVIVWVKFNYLDYTNGTGKLIAFAGKGWPDSASPNAGWWFSYDNRNNGKSFTYTCFGNSAGGYAGGGNNFSGPSYYYTFTTDRFYCIGFTIKNSVGRLYIDGVQIGPAKTFSNLVLSDPSRILTVGRLSTASLYHWGIIRQILIYNRGLSDSEIRWNYENPESPITTGLVLWLKMDEGSGNIVHDYSGYGNHGTIYGAKWVSSVGSAPATINVNITASQVTFNVNVINDSLDVKATIIDSRVDIKVVITDCVVDLKIYTPVGRWIIAPEVLATYAVNPYRSVSPGAEVTIISASGFKGRLKQIGGELVTAGNPFSIYGNVEIRIYVDGMLRIRLKIDEIDFLNGRATYWLWTALLSCLANNLTPPFNCVRYTTSPERWLIMPFFSNPAAAVTMVVVDRSTGLQVRVGFYFKVDVEFQNSVEVRVYNGDSSNTLGVMMTGLLGEYVWPTG